MAVFILEQSALEGPDALEFQSGGIFIQVDRIWGGEGSGVGATTTTGPSTILIQPATAVGIGAGLSTVTGILISPLAPASGTGSGVTPTMQTRFSPTIGVGTGSGISAALPVLVVPTTGLGIGSGVGATISTVVVVPAAATWEVRIYDLNASSPRLTFAPVADWSFGYVLNAPGSFEAKVPLTNAQAAESNFRAGQREIKVYRNSALVWGGYLWQTSVDVSNFEVRLVGEGYYSRLRKRFVMSDLIYDSPGLEQEAIAWRLVRHTEDQSPRTAGQPAGPPWGELNISQGSNTLTTVRQRDYCAAQHPNIADSIDELTQMDDGFDFCITPTAAINTDKVFSTFTPRKQVHSSVLLNGSNLMSLNYDIDASDVATRMTTIGSGDCNPPDDDRTANSIQNFGLLQDIEDVQFSNLSDVQSHGKEQLRNRNSSRWQATVEFNEADGPAWGTFDIGDTVTLAANKGFANFSQDMRVVEYNVALQPGIKRAFTTLTLDSVIA